MQIARNSLETQPGPSDWFTGAVYIDTITTPSDASAIGAASVHFTPGARTAWQTHPHGQTIWVTEGIGLCQHEGRAPSRSSAPATASSLSRAKIIGTAPLQHGS
jgi:quercetin dioxygenase-like cupin family protein